MCDPRPSPTAAPWSSCRPTRQTSLCLLAVPYPTLCLCFLISISFSLAPLAYFSVPSQISASFSPPSSLSPHCSRGTSPAKLSLPALPTYSGSATPPPHTSPPSFCRPPHLHGPFCCGTGRASVICSAPYLSPLLIFCLPPKIGASMFKVSWQRERNAPKGLALTRV